MRFRLFDSKCAANVAPSRPLESDVKLPSRIATANVASARVSSRCLKARSPPILDIRRLPWDVRIGAKLSRIAVAYLAGIQAKICPLRA